MTPILIGNMVCFIPAYKIKAVSQPVKKAPKKFSCRVCTNAYTDISSRRKHEIKKHNFHPKQKLNYTYTCRVCISKFTNTWNRRRHEINKHNFNPDSKQELTCYQCFQVFKCRIAIMKHISSSHADIILNKEIKQFKTMKEFESWKVSIEKETACSFYAYRTTKNKDHSVKDYLCHQSGKLISKSQGIRRLKASGSYKSGFFCPANMKVRIGSDIIVTFLSTHIGHTCEVDNPPLSVPEKNEFTVLKEINASNYTILDETEISARNSTIMDETEISARNSTIMDETEISAPNSTIMDETEICASNSTIMDETAQTASPVKRKLIPAWEKEALSQPIKARKKFSCRVCNNAYTDISSRRKHEIKKHNFHPKQKLNYTYTCRVCISKFTNTWNRRRHEINKHNFNPDSKQELTCYQCFEVFNCRRAIMTHISSNHANIILKKEMKQFKTMKEFESWKVSIEKETACSFYAYRTTKNKDHSVKDYLCHQSGKLISKSQGIRRLKASGSYKSGFFCPANMKLRIGSVIDVTFLSTHIGHHCDVDHPPLSVPEENEFTVLKEISAPNSTVMNETAQTTSPTKRKLIPASKIETLSVLSKPIKNKKKI